MKKLLLLSFVIFLAFSCKKTEFEPEGPTDVRIKNLSNLSFNEVIIKTSENEEDVDTIAILPAQSISDYIRFSKAYTQAEISAKIDDVLFSTGTVNFTYLTYIGQDRITFEVYISDMNNKKLSIGNVIREEPLILK